MVGRLRRWFDAPVRLLWPSRCVACNLPGTWWCADCDDRVVIVRNPECPRCGRIGTGGRFCPACRRHGPLTGILAGARYRQPIRAAILALKYRHTAAVVPSLVRYLLVPLATLRGLDHAVVVPVPLHPRRLRQRGHNQAELLARTLTTATRLRLSDGLKRIRYTPSQTGLDRKRRHSNVANAFAWRGESLEGRLVVVVDDVATTGATLQACAAALRQAGARQVWGLVVARR